MTTNQLISELKLLVQSNLELIDTTFGKLNQSQMNWRKDADSWNLNEIFAHLNEYSYYYHPTIKLKIKNTRFKEPRDIFISSPLGRSAWKSMKLGNANNIKRKFKSPKAYNPTHFPELITGKDLQTFKEGQQELLEIIESAQKVNLRKVKIPISISKIIRLRLGDALLFIVYHNQRHVQQALNLMNLKSFPR